MKRDEQIRFVQRSVLIGVGAALIKVPLDLVAQPHAQFSALTDPETLKVLAAWACGLVLAQGLIDVGAALYFSASQPRVTDSTLSTLAFGASLTCLTAELLKCLASFVFDAVRAYWFLSQASPTAPGRSLLVGSLVVGGAVTTALSLLGGIFVGAMTGGIVGFLRRQIGQST